MANYLISSPKFHAKFVIFVIENANLAIRRLRDVAAKLPN